ncbi:MAG: hypothetical protein ACXVZW_07530 [Gaiellaceae bacterium]
MSARAATRDTIELRGESAEVALAEAQAVLAMVSEADRRARLGALVGALGEGRLDASGEEAQALEELLELGLQSGRLRALYGPSGEQAMLRLYRRLPRGRELAKSARQVSEALGALVGSRLAGLRLEALGPGAFQLSLSVEGRELSVRLDTSGARIQSVAV